MVNLEASKSSRGQLQLNGSWIVLRLDQQQRSAGVVLSALVCEIAIAWLSFRLMWQAEEQTALWSTLAHPLAHQSAVPVKADFAFAGLIQMRMNVKHIRRNQAF